MSITEEQLVRLQEDVARLRGRICATCGFTEMRHGIPVPDDWTVDPAAYPCDNFTEKEV